MNAAVMAILDRAAELLREHHRPLRLEWISGQKRKRAWEQVAAIYRAVGELGIRYIVAPASFENTGQKVRSLRTFCRSASANCLDLSLLFFRVL